MVKFDLKLKKRILDNISASRDDDALFKKAVDSFLDKLNLSSKKLNYDTSFLVGGSFGKETYLKGSFDVDIFARFDLKYDDSKLSLYLKEILDEANIIYFKQKGSRDYFSGDYEEFGVKFKFELVPNYNIINLEDAKNSTDFSPKHVDFLKNRVLKDKNILDEIKLTKQLFKAKGFYGAESYINGFSGHSIDVLIMQFGSLKNLLEEALIWGDRVILDIANHYKNQEDVLLGIDVSKQSNLILVDPILKDRNAARALGSQIFSEFILFCQNLEELVEDDFKIEKVSSKDFLKKSLKFKKNLNLKRIVYNFDLIDVVSSDICGSKLVKLFEKIKKYYVSFGFDLFLDDFFIDFNENRCIVVMYFEEFKLSKKKLVLGPKVFMKDAVNGFLKGRCDYFVKDSRVCYFQDRSFLEVFDVTDLTLVDLKKMFYKDLSFINSFDVLKD